MIAFNSGGLSDKISLLDREFEARAASQRARVKQLDGPARAALLRAARGEPSPLMVSIYLTLALLGWDEARRRSGAPELCVVGRGRPESVRLPDLRAALAVYHADRPSLGVGPLEPQVALDGARMRPRDGFQVRGGDGFRWVGAELKPNPSRSGTARPREIGRLDLWLDVGAILKPFQPEEPWPWLVEVVYGRWRRCPRGDRLGRLTRDTKQVILVRQPAERIAFEQGLPRKLVRDGVRELRRRVETALAGAEIIPRRKARYRAPVTKIDAPVFFGLR